MSTSSSPSVLIDPSTSEPYLLLTSARLPPNTEIRLTPVRSTDADRLVHVYNQPEIGKRLYSTPWPYLPSDAQNTISNWTADYPSSTASLLRTSPSSPSSALAAHPFKTIRIYRTSPSPSAPSPSIADATPEPIPAEGGLLIGTIGVFTERNDVSGVWDLGYVLLNEYAGKGVVGAAVAAMMTFWEAWGAEENKVKTWEAFVETDNPGSLKLLEKLGFEVVEIDPKNAWPEAKGGGFRECATLKRGRLDGKD